MLHVASPGPQNEQIKTSARKERFLLAYSCNYVPLRHAGRRLVSIILYEGVAELSSFVTAVDDESDDALGCVLQAGNFEANAVKRADDTEILIGEMKSHHPDSDRGSLALRRLNFIHSQYRISNDDYLYVLALFILEPQRWIHQ